jgi:DNA mismatch endonuclease Vsr
VTPQRSALMRRVKGKDSEPEMVVRSVAHRLGCRFRLHRRDLPGSPDLVFISRIASQSIKFSRQSVPCNRGAYFVIEYHRGCLNDRYHPRRRTAVVPPGDFETATVLQRQHHRVERKMRWQPRRFRCLWTSRKRARAARPAPRSLRCWQRREPVDTPRR